MPSQSYLYFRFLFFQFFFAFSLFAVSSPPKSLFPKIISKIPHKLPAFTQGLFCENDELYESCGLYGKSLLRQINWQSGHPLRSLTFPPHLFAEGITCCNNEIILLTWREHQALAIDRQSLKLKHTLFYEGEGWGLCQENGYLWMSNGSSTIVKRDPKTFEILLKLHVSLSGKPLENINDLECTKEALFANVWKTNDIIQINKENGRVLAVIDASSLLTEEEKKLLTFEDTLNGIAYRPKTNTFYITGKNWPWIFEVIFVSANEDHSTINF